MQTSGPWWIPSRALATMTPSPEKKRQKVLLTTPLGTRVSRGWLQRWFPLSPPSQKAEDPFLGSEGWGSAGLGVVMGGASDPGRRTSCTEQRRAADFTHYNPVIQASSPQAGDPVEPPGFRQQSRVPH